MGSGQSKKKRKLTSWEDAYGELKAYQATHGDCDTSEPLLKKWMMDQRKNKHKLTLQQIGKLHRLGFDWATYVEKERSSPMQLADVSGGISSDPDARKPDDTPSKRDEKWEEKFHRLLKFRESRGHTRVPLQNAEDPKLGRWVAFQRSRYKQGKVRRDRIEKLDAIGFEWVVSQHVPNATSKTPPGTALKPGFKKWEKNFESLLHFKEENGHTRVPCYDKANPQLADWVQTQRNLNRAGTISRDHKEKLDEIGFEWARNHQKQWEDTFERLRRFKELHGHTSPPQHAQNNNDPQLGWWVTRQRRLHHLGTIQQDRKEKLDSIGFVWVPRQALEGMRVSSTASFTQENSSPPHKREWAAHEEQNHSVPIPKKRKKYSNASGDEKRSVKSDVLPSTEQSQEEWSKMFERLCRYKVENGNCSVAVNNPGGDLTVWLQMQRELRARGNLSEQRSIALSAVGVDWKQPRD